MVCLVVQSSRAIYFPKRVPRSARAGVVLLGISPASPLDVWEGINACDRFGGMGAMDGFLAV